MTEHQIALVATKKITVVRFFRREGRREGGREGERDRGREGEREGGLSEKGVT